jgi:hypothetical protein
MNAPLRVALVVTICGAFLTACGEDATTNAGQEGSATVSPSQEPAAPLEGTWESGEVTQADLYAAGETLGLSRSETKANFWGAPSVLPLTFEVTIQEGRWVQTQVRTDGVEEFGWEGTYQIGVDGTVIATDPCGSVTYECSLSGDTLTIDMLENENECAGSGGDTRDGELLAQTLIYESTPFTRVN